MSAYTEMRFFAGPNLKIFSSRRSRMFSRSRRRLPRGSSSTRRPPGEAGKLTALDANCWYGVYGRPDRARKYAFTPTSTTGTWKPRRTLTSWRRLFVSSPFAFTSDTLGVSYAYGPPPPLVELLAPQEASMVLSTFP